VELSENLLEEAQSRRAREPARIPIRQDDDTSLGGWYKDDSSPEARSRAIMVDEAHAAVLGGEPTKRIVQVLKGT